MKPKSSFLLLFLIIVVYLVATWFVTIAPYSKTQQFFASLPNIVTTNIISRYPPALEVAVTNGVVSLNQKAPYCFVISDNAGVIVDPTAAPDTSLLTASGPYSELCRPLALVGGNFVIFPDQNDSFTTQSIPTDINVTLNRGNIVDFSNKYLPSLISFGRQAYFVLPFIGSVFVYLFLLLNNLWYAYVVRFVCKIFKKPIPEFGQAYHLSLFFYSFLIIFDWYFLGALSYFLKTNLNFSFLLRNTILISAASLYYYSRYPAPPVSDIKPTV